MPVILEEEEGIAGGAFVPPDFTELLSLPEAAFTATDEMQIGALDLANPLQPFVQSPTIPTDGIAHDLMGDWDIPLASADPYTGLEEPDYAKFENWIPQFIRPVKPCDYCRVKRLNCYITRGESACTPCSSLFRDCSLTNSSTLEAINQTTGYLLDTLHVVDEDAVRERGSVTGIKPLRSKSYNSGTSTPVGHDDAPGSSKRNGIRFPRHAVKILRDWLDIHAGNPYPTEEEKLDLENRTELKPSQIANWLANARRRRKVTERARPRLCASPSLRPSTPAIDITQPDKPWDELNPLERWQHSPPENEPASLTDIANAVEQSELPEDEVSTSPSSYGKQKKRSSNGSNFSGIRAASTTSFETGQSSSLSATNSAAYSHQSSHSHGSFGSFNSSLAGKRDRRRRRKTGPAPIRKITDEKKRIFQCTFCTDTFKSKYDWTRHEKSLHLSLEKWICAPTGPIITDPQTGEKRCVYCDKLNPSQDHLETHNHRQCEEKGLDARTFYRKDHLRQHVRLMHNCEMTSHMDDWKSIAANINSRCGFCAQRFTVWQERVDHLTAHFKSGASMKEWKGCRGLDPAVAAQVTNAMPPYLIGMESVSPNPFSASNKATWRQNLSSASSTDAHTRDRQAEEGHGGCLFLPESVDLQGFGSKATCWEILTVQLGKYATEMTQKGVVLTDEMLQRQSRLLLYGTDDSWNQTDADNPEWLDLFKKAHGLGFIPTQIGGTGANVPEDLETYSDLGLRIPFAVQLQAYNNKLENPACDCANAVDCAHAEPAKSGQIAERTQLLYRLLANEGVLYNATGMCSHMECDQNEIEIQKEIADRAPKFRWCTYALTPEKAEEVAKLRAQQQAGQNTTERNVSHSASSGSSMPAKKSFLQRHRYQLPEAQARNFETITGAWEDSGMMPPAVQTAVQQEHTMIDDPIVDLFGTQNINAMPFEIDSQTQLPVSSEAWTLPNTTTAQEAAIIAEIDRLMAETVGTQASAQQTLYEDPYDSVANVDGTNLMAEELDLPADFHMQDLNFEDLDMGFDGVFDITIDESGRGQ